MDRLPPPLARVVGSLIEKQLTVPQQYPLTANALVAACNQASNRDPVSTYGEGEVLAALAELRERRLVRYVLPSHGRSAVRYRHVLDEVLGLDPAQLAVLAVLLLRGPQTPGELRARTDRMADLGHAGSVEHELELLAARDEPLVERLGRRSGQKEDRWATTLSDPAADPAHDGAMVPTDAPTSAVASMLDALGIELADLRREVSALRADVAELRENLGG